jgi:hypothetical protein
MARQVMAVTAAALLLQGGALLILPQELLTACGFDGGRGNAMVAQLLGSALIGFAALNWGARAMILGGPYGRPIVAANFTHAAIAAMVLLRALLDDVGGVLLAASAAVWILVAAAFAWLLFADPIGASRRQTEPEPAARPPAPPGRRPRAT